MLPSQTSHLPHLQLLNNNNNLTSSCPDQEWVSVGSTVGQVVLSQLAADKSHSLVNMETRARHLTLMGKYLRQLAVQEHPNYMWSLWDRHKQVHKIQLLSE